MYFSVLVIINNYRTEIFHELKFHKQSLHMINIFIKLQAHKQINELLQIDDSTVNIQLQCTREEFPFIFTNGTALN